jgi:hypothetical protein
MLDEVVVVPTESLLTQSFGESFRDLPPHIKDIVHEKYHRWREHPNSLNFEYKFGNIYAVEITRKIHAVATVTGGVVKWFFVGDYRAYIGKLDELRAVLHK